MLNTDGVDCDLSNWNAFGDTSTRRIMLNKEYSYRYKYSNGSESGWWQGRIENLQYCVVFENLIWRPNECDSYNEEKYHTEKEFVDNLAQFIAYGTFDVITDTEKNADFENYLENKINSDNGTLFKHVMNKLMNTWFSENAFELISVSVEENVEEYTKNEVDTFAEAALDITYGLYGFMAFCCIMAILAKVNAVRSGADFVRPVSLFFAIVCL